MEPWDGPAAVAFSDGVNAGAILDRNGLRPARYSLTKDGIFVLASETGVLDLKSSEIVRKGRLKPGEMIYCDLEKRRLVFDAELKNDAARRKPYRRWAEEGKISVHGLFDSVNPSEVPEHISYRQQLFGWSREDVEILVQPMAETGHEPVGSMGNDASLAVLSEKPQLLSSTTSNSFSAQVTEPARSTRSARNSFQSLTTYIGNEGNILSDEQAKSRLIKLPRPVLTDEDIRRLSALSDGFFSAVTLPLGWKENLEGALAKLEQDAISHVKNGKNIVILSDRALAGGEMADTRPARSGGGQPRPQPRGLRPPVGLTFSPAKSAKSCTTRSSSVSAQRQSILIWHSKPSAP